MLASLEWAKIRKSIPSGKLFFLGLFFWSLFVGAGLLIVWKYENMPVFETVPPPAHWPLKNLDYASDRFTLVMLAHPKCPCTRASIGELEQIMAHGQNKLQAYVFFVKPKNFSESWAESDLWKRAEAIPGVKLILDEEGNQARYFNGSTSGQTYLYDSHGELVFHGGITGSRGHSGDNSGEKAIIQLVNGEKANVKQTFTFGCLLFSKHPLKGDENVNTTK